MKKSKRSMGIRISIVSGIVIICLVLVALPFFQANKQGRTYQTLSSTMRSLFTTIQNTDSSSSWRYSESCSDIYTGDFSTGDIVCSSSIRLQTAVTNATIAKDLHETYYGIIKENSNFTPSSDLSIEPSKTFGKAFVVSAVERSYTVNNLPDVSCRYSLSLGQQNENSSNFTLGSAIPKGKGTISISFSCSGNTTSYWYTKA